MKPTQNHRMDQLLHKTLDWKCKQCFRDQNSVKPKTTGNQCTVTDRLYELKKKLKKTSKACNEILVLKDILARYSS